MKHLSQKTVKLLWVVVLACCFPVFVLAQEGLVPCGVDEMCTVNDFFKLIANIIEFLLFTIGLPLTVVAIAWGGTTMVLNANNPGKRQEGRTIIQNSIIGFAIALASYIIVDTILTTLTDQNLDQLQTEAGIDGGVEGEQNP